MRPHRHPFSATYVEIANLTKTVANWQGGSSTWVLVGFSIPIAGYTVAAGHQVELKLEAPGAASTNMWVAYDATAYLSTFKLP